VLTDILIDIKVKLKTSALSVCLSAMCVCVVAAGGSKLAGCPCSSWRLTRLSHASSSNQPIPVLCVRACVRVILRLSREIF